MAVAAEFIEAFVFIGLNAVVLSFLAGRAGYSGGKIAGFWYALGLLSAGIKAGRGSLEDLPLFGYALGGVCALLLLWFFWFKDRKEQVDG